MRINFNGVPEAGKFAPLPAGQYHCRLKAIKEELTKSEGKPMWALKWEVIDGEQATRFIFDRIVLEGPGLSRLKLLLSRLGIDANGDTEVHPGILQGKLCWVTTEIKMWQGQAQTKVTFAGYSDVEETEPERQSVDAGGGPARSDDEIPF